VIDVVNPLYREAVWVH